VRRANAPADNVARAIANIAEQIGDGDLDLVILFVTSKADLNEVARESILTFRHTRIVGCTTAGEISKNGYTSEEIVAIGFSKDSFTTDILFISAGFDAHRADPLAMLNFETADYGWATSALMAVADDCCGGRVVSTLEGGYDLNALAASAAAHVRALMG